MEHIQGSAERLQASLNQQSAMPNLGRWLTGLDNADLMGLALMALEGQNFVVLRSMVRVLMAAEGLYRPRESNEKKYIERLGWHALAEYAYRKDWALINNNPALTTDARETTEITALGYVMMTALGPSSKVAYWLGSCVKTDHLN